MMTIHGSPCSGGLCGTLATRGSGAFEGKCFKLPAASECMDFGNMFCYEVAVICASLFPYDVPLDAHLGAVFKLGSVLGSFPCSLLPTMAGSEIMSRWS